MQPTMALRMLFAAALLLLGVGAEKAADRTITQVVKLLQSMLDKSKADGVSERDLYSKYKCYCDDNEAAKKQEISSLTEEIGLLESEIDGLQASSAQLSKDVAKLKADMENNVADRQKAGGVRAGEAAAYLALSTDLSGAIATMTQAIDVLAEVGADQTLGQAAADHSKFMASYEPASLVKLRSAVKQALVAASAFVSKKQAAPLEALLQAPFTGAYSAQSGEVVGILKDMRDTFKRNLAEATATENAALEAFGKYMQAMIDAYNNMDTSYQNKQGMLAANDGALGTKRAALATAEADLGAAQTFLAQLLEMCGAKAKEYSERVTLRSSEEAAIAEAIAILNSDAAFESFGTVTATKSGATSFLQQVSIRRHDHGLAASRRMEAQALLQRAAKRSARLARVAAMLQAGNPFDIVLAEIQKMVDLIAKEDKADDDQLAWCNSERATNRAELGRKNNQISTLEGEIQVLIQAIEDPVTGLKALIQADEDSLSANFKSQESETKMRKEENRAYQQDVENLVEAERLLEKATAVLRRYYAKILGSEGSLLQGAKQPTPPATWTGAYKGQSEHGGTDAVSMLEFILGETKKEEREAHEAEEQSQHGYEDSMQQLKGEEQRLEQSLASLRLSLAQAEKELLGKQADLKATVAEKEAIEAYLLQIKPGCDFITENIGLRKANRVAETQALQSAEGLIKATPVYQTAVAAAHNATLGGCLEICAGSEEHVDCKACLARVSVPGYCAGHAGTLGC
mmetsp:Transcript_96605/g.273190  ORF Transcript_96605/g.273190 Transcript_96605/m.273190 type:complete len:746 (-) Transcript_96605:89-2326(-)